MSMFAPEAWTCSFPDFCLGMPPRLPRSTPLLIEELCRSERNLNILFLKMLALTQPPNRFVRSDILALMHDTKRRLGIITGARACDFEQTWPTWQKSLLRTSWVLQMQHQMFCDCLDGANCSFQGFFQDWTVSCVFNI